MHGGPGEHLPEPAVQGVQKGKGWGAAAASTSTDTAQKDRDQQIALTAPHRGGEENGQQQED